ncbi:TRAP transporter substrate-binding protein [Sporomusa malonica]|uniref:Tripartite ATP-independent transporter solute receptor, DctP family n=1 Tax=Sporomusa malonica TaxID=112901 RepID=A0A1W2EGB5_9FIRM|nr:TRAP transporter substrate-binding protein [Sporomusa malonica]SMD08158.1 tripartite ATP-independent transporter solute receptor, DctP family [Sporomusa malonica]
MKKKTACFLVLILMLSVALVGCGGSSKVKSDAKDNQAVTTIKVGHVLAPDHPYTLGLKKFAELMDKKTNGKVKVNVFHSSQLGNERDMIEALQLGTQQMALVSTAPLASFTKQFLVFDLPFMFDNYQGAYKVLDGEIGKSLLKTLESQGIVGLNYWENGYRHVTNSKRPINKPEDLAGLKIRLMENPIHMDTFKAMGANPLPMAFGELFTALQQGTIDAQENPVPIIWTSRFYEVQKYGSLTGHFYAAAPLLVSQKFYQGLPADQQKALMEAANEARDYERQLLAEQNKDFISKLKEKGMQILEVDKAPFKAAVQSVWKQYESTIGKDLIDKVLNGQK